MFVAGFYYKTFMWPKSFWEKIYEPIIRKAAGLGSASKEADRTSMRRPMRIVICLWWAPALPG
jgi:NADPH-dependent 2,4-dienoyl-CoA reductase/sulfur reductase-like enzyme